MVSHHCQGVCQAVPPQSRLQEMPLGPCPEALRGTGLGSARFGSSRPLRAQGVPLEPVGQCLQPFPTREDKSLPWVSVGPARLKNECLCKIPGMGASSAPTPELLHPSKAKNVDRNLGSLLLQRGKGRLQRTNATSGFLRLAGKRQQLLCCRLGLAAGRAPRFWAGFGQESEGAEASRGAVSLPGAWVQAWVGEPAGGVPLVLRFGFLRLLPSVQLTHPRY